jgi:hypothetical protein
LIFNIKKLLGEKMKLKTTLGALSLSVILTLSGCGGSDGNGSGNGSGNGNNGSGGANSTNYSKTFKALSIGDQVEELMGGVIGIADEVGHGKMGDPMGDTLAQADTTKVESQFSWNSTKDFYDNIYSIKKVWDGGLGDIATGVDASKATVIETEIGEALALITAISDKNGDGVLETSDIADGTTAFRNQIGVDEGRAKIAAAQTKLASLQTHLEELKPILSNTTLTDAYKTKATAVVDNVIVKGYTDLEDEADKLVNALKNLKNNPTADNVTKARDQWRATRSPWEAGEGHIFGPVETLGVDPKVDSWPVDKTSLDGALGGWDPELSNIDGFPVNMKGFHAIEYLLFGDGTAQETPEAAATRLKTVVGDDEVADKMRLKYLTALGKSFHDDIETLADAWTK